MSNEDEKPWLVMIPGFRCQRCGYEWIPKDIDGSPESCPGCRTRKWREEK